ncbi:DUF2975 domain-containing protein [Hymenobacter sp.]|uniref:DUF2975 domain-containing protein n=1 Tax=Hymenobacter sp. TaxID=1898978 RepID=UPI00286CB422|nr:DUF2975 domain-containing protein [Hymenobacter sp.]
MAFLVLPKVLRTGMMRIGLFLAFLFSLGALFSVFALVISTFSTAAGDPEVRLMLDRDSPNIFSTIHEIKAGWASADRPQAPLANRQPLLVSRRDSASFELTSRTPAPLLRYVERSAWKRVALLHLGALNGTMSLAWVMYFSLGSWLITLLLLDVTPATPFTYGNARRLRSLGVLVLGLNVLQGLGYLLVRELVPAFRTPDLTEPLGHYVRFSTETMLPGWELGVMLLIIAAVYRRGVELSQEAELVI